MDEAQICENCGFERELNRGLCEGCEAERIATAPLLATIATLESRLAEVERERDEARRLAYLGEHHFPDLTWKARCEETVKRLRTLEAAAREAADLIGVVASEVEGDAASVYGQVRWARDARRVEASIRAALEGGG